MFYPQLVYKLHFRTWSLLFWPFWRVRVKRFMSVFCKWRDADDFFLIGNLLAISDFTFYLFWVKVPLSQHRPALHTALQQNGNTDFSWKWIIWQKKFAFLWFILLNAHFLLITYIPRGKDTKSLFLVYNLLTTELQKVFYLPLFYCEDWSQLHYLVDMNLFNENHIVFSYKV